MGGLCSTISDVIPDKEVMLEVVDLMVSFEERLKKGERLTSTQKRQKRALSRVAKEMRRTCRVQMDISAVTKPVLAHPVPT